MEKVRKRDIHVKDINEEIDGEETSYGIFTVILWIRVSQAISADVIEWRQQSINSSWWKVFALLGWLCKSFINWKQFWFALYELSVFCMEYFTDCKSIHVLEI